MSMPLLGVTQPSLWDKLDAGERYLQDSAQVFLLGAISDEVSHEDLDT